MAQVGSKTSELNRKRARAKSPTRSELDSSFEEPFYFLVAFTDEKGKSKGEHAIVDDSKIFLSSSKSGVVKHLGKSYNVEVICSGNIQVIKRKAEKYRCNLSLDTSCDEQEKSKKTKEIQLNNLINSMSNSSISQFAHDHPSIQTSESSDSNPSTLNICGTSSQMCFNKDYLEDIGRKFDQLNKKIADLEAKSVTNDANKFFVDSVKTNKKINIVKEVNEKNGHKWVLKAVEHIFTEHELINGITKFSKNSQKKLLEPEKLQLLRDAMDFKYKYDASKSEAVWALSCSKINSKGRNLSKRLADMFRNRNATVINGE